MTPRTSRRALATLAAAAFFLGTACSSDDAAGPEKTSDRPPATDADGQPIEGGSLSGGSGGPGGDDAGDGSGSGSGSGDDGASGDPDSPTGSPGSGGGSPDDGPGAPGDGSPDGSGGNGPTPGGPDEDGSSGGSDGGSSDDQGGGSGGSSDDGPSDGSDGGSGSGPGSQTTTTEAATTTTTEAPQVAPLVLRVNSQSCAGGRPRVSITAGAGRGRQANLRSVTVERQNEYGAWLSSAARWLGPETGGNADQWTADSVSGQRFGTTLRITAVANDGQRQTVNHNITGGC